MLKVIWFIICSFLIPACSLFAVNNVANIQTDSQKIIKPQEKAVDTKKNSDFNNKMMFEKFQNLNQPPKAPKKVQNKNIILDIQTPHGGAIETKITDDSALKEQQPNHLQILNFEPNKTDNKSLSPTIQQQNIQAQQQHPNYPQNVHQIQENSRENHLKPYEHEQPNDVTTRPYQLPHPTPQPQGKTNEVFINR